MRAAVFVDAGYLYTAGSIVLTGSSQNREVMELIPLETVTQLKTSVEGQTDGIPLLRIYWYDGLVRGRRSLEQDRMAIEDDVKLRLGTVTGGRQKGVDSLIVTDLIELARNHAISDAVLLSGDEDLRIGVQIAQSFGVRVHLIGIEPSRANQSNLLREEADTVREWSKADVEKILSVNTERTVVTGGGRVQDQHGGIASSTIEILQKVSKSIVDSISVNELANFDVEQPSSPIPREYDARLLRESGTRLNRDLEPSERHHLRELFKEDIRHRIGEGS
jgi:uncharacterized LabA/DUF88 family protein